MLCLNDARSSYLATVISIGLEFEAPSKVRKLNQSTWQNVSVYIFINRRIEYYWEEYKKGQDHRVHIFLEMKQG